MATADPMANVPPNQSMPAIRLIAVTPNDTTDLPNGICRALWIGGAGTVTVIGAIGDASVALVGANAGQEIHSRISRVLSTGTTATSIVAMY